MPLSTTYSLNRFSSLTVSDYVPPGTTIYNPDITALEAGGFAVIGTDGTNTYGSIHDASGRRAADWSRGETDSAIDQLANGDLVIAGVRTTDPVNLFFATVSGTTGQTTLAARPVLPILDNHLRADVTALDDGRFVVAAEGRHPTGTKFPVLWLYAADGTFVDFAGPRPFTGARADIGVAALEDGNVAFAYTSADAAGTDILYGRAVDDGFGGILNNQRDPLASLGEVNRNPSVVATDGGFAVAYEADNSTGIDIALAQLDLAGRILRYSNVSDIATGDEAHPYLASLPDGRLAVSFEDHATGSARIVTNLIDASGDILDSIVTTGGGAPSDDVETPAVAAFGPGRLAVVHANLTRGSLEAELLQVTRTVRGDAAANSIGGDEMVDVFFGGGGDDTLAGGRNHDRLSGGSGGDVLAGGPGADMLDGGPGADRLEGGPGRDTTTYARSGAAVFADLARGIFRGGEAEGDRVVSVENLLGSRFADRLFGDQGPNVVSGNAGNDRIDGRAGDDRLGGLAGNDVLTGGPGADLIVGGPGTDFAAYGTSAGRVIVNLSTGRGAGNDAAGDRLFSVEAIVGSRFGDRLIGNPADNRLLGGAGNDALIGGPGNDRLAGGPGRDTLNGGAGNDVLAGGPDGDFFRYAKGFGRDTVTGFENDLDNLLLDDALWGGGLRPGQVLSAFGTQKAPNAVEFDFGNGDVLTVLGPGLTLPQLQDDILIV